MFWRKKNEIGEDYDVVHVKENSNDEIKVVWANGSGNNPTSNSNNNTLADNDHGPEEEGFWKRQFKKLGISKDDTKSAAVQLYDKYTLSETGEVSSDDLPVIIDDFFNIFGIQSSLSSKQIAWVMNLLSIKPGDHIDLKMLKRVFKLVSGAKGYFSK